MLPRIPYCSRSGKPCYDKRAATTAANLRYKEAHIRLRIYPCPDCNWWHLTKTNYWKYPKRKRY